MGVGDELIGSGVARGAKARGKRVAFGDGRKIIWHPNAHLIYKGNPNVAPPGSEKDSDIEWVAHYSGSRLYNRQGNGRWLWKPFKPIPGEIYFEQEELKRGSRYGKDFIVIEPYVPRQKSVAVNKQWPLERWRELSRDLARRGHGVVQFMHAGGEVMPHARPIKTSNFRLALSILRHAKLVICHEGGLHHGAAAIGVPAVVLFGGFIHPRTTGYDMHSNIFTGVGFTDSSGEEHGCGSLTKCDHCQAAMKAITAQMVMAECDKLLGKK